MKQIRCRNCGAEFDWKEKRCTQCGKRSKAFRTMDECRGCGELVAQNANKCPYCGMRTPSKKMLIAQLIITAYIVVVFLGIGYSVFNNVPDSAESGTGSQNQESVNPTQEVVKPIEISAVDLWKAYMENEVRADILYGGKQRAVTGKVVNIGKDIVNDNPCISLDTGSSYNLYPIQCFFDKRGDQISLLGSLHDGDVVTIYGKCTGMFVAHVQLSDCTIEIHE